MHMKSQPLAYNKDNQEDKEPLFDTIDTLRDCMLAMTGLIPNIEAKADNMLAATHEGFTTATDLADYLVRAGVAFRDAHEMVGQTVAYAISTNKRLHELGFDELQNLCNGVLKQDVYHVLTLEGSFAARNHHGGTAPKQVREALARARERLQNH
jgi:argininosuccinate lyase